MKSAHPAILCLVGAEEALRTRIDRDVSQMPIEEHDPLDRLQEAARGHRNPRTWRRVQAVILAKLVGLSPIKRRSNCSTRVRSRAARRELAGRLVPLVD